MDLERHKWIFSSYTYRQRRGFWFCLERFQSLPFEHVKANLNLFGGQDVGFWGETLCPFFGKPLPENNARDQQHSKEQQDQDLVSFSLLGEGSSSGKCNCHGSVVSYVSYLDFSLIGIGLYAKRNFKRRACPEQCRRGRNKSNRINRKQSPGVLCAL